MAVQASIAAEPACYEAQRIQLGTLGEQEDRHIGWVGARVGTVGGWVGRSLETGQVAVQADRSAQQIQCRCPTYTGRYRAWVGGWVR